MTKNVLLIGRTGVVIDDVQQQLRMPDIRFFGATGLDDVRAAFAQAAIDHAIMGAGLDLETRLQIVREILLESEAVTVHMKDHASGSQGFPPFVRSVLHGMKDYELERSS